MGTSVAAPKPRDYGQETADTLAAQVKLAPALYSAEAMFQPGYNLLNLSNLQDFMLGTQAGTRTVDQVTPESSMRLKDAVQRGLVRKLPEESGLLGGLGKSLGIGGGVLGSALGPMGAVAGAVGGSALGKARAGGYELTDLGRQQGYSIVGKSLFKPQETKPVSFNVPNQRGLLDIYQNDIYPTLSRIEAADAETRRASDLASIQKYGQDYTAALLGANPQQKALLDEFNRQAMLELQAGQSLTSAEQRQAQQASRAAFAARGMGIGNQAVADEIFKSYQLGAQRQAQRRQFASGVFGMNQTATGDPFLQILGRPSQMLPQGMGFGQQGMAATQGLQMFNPESQYAGDIYNQRYQGQLAANTASAANRAALIGAGIQAAGSMAGSAMKFCWVAREVYGNYNPAWLEFRHWLLTRAPRWLVRLYARHGEAFAAYISDKPKLKRIIRELMDLAIAR